MTKMTIPCDEPDHPAPDAHNSAAVRTKRWISTHRRQLSISLFIGFATIVLVLAILLVSGMSKKDGSDIQGGANATATSNHGTPRILGGQDAPGHVHVLLETIPVAREEVSSDSVITAPTLDPAAIVTAVPHASHRSPRHAAPPVTITQGDDLICYFTHRPNVEDKWTTCRQDRPTGHPTPKESAANGRSRRGGPLGRLYRHIKGWLGSFYRRIKGWLGMGRDSSLRNAAHIKVIVAAGHETNSNEIREEIERFEEEWRFLIAPNTAASFLVVVVCFSVSLLVALLFLARAHDDIEASQQRAVHLQRRNDYLTNQLLHIAAHPVHVHHVHMMYVVQEAELALLEELVLMEELFPEMNAANQRREREAARNP